MWIQYTPSDLLVFSGLAVTVISFWLMFHRSARERRPPGEGTPEIH